MITHNPTDRSRAAPHPTGGERAALYVRVSTGQQERDGTSLESQEQDCRRFAAELGYDVAAVFREVQSAIGADSVFKRPQLTKLRDAVARRQFDAVVVWHTDRLARGTYLTMLRAEGKHYGCRILSSTQPNLDETNEQEAEQQEITDFIDGIAARREWERTRARTSRARVARVMAGKPLVGHKVKYGYAWQDGSHAALTPDLLTAPVVTRIFRLLASGHSLRGVAKILNDEGVRPPFTALTWTHTSVRVLARDSRYAGQSFAFIYASVPTGNGNKRRSVLRPVEERVPLPEGTYPTLIDRPTFDAVQHLLDGNRERMARPPKLPTLLRGGFAVCGNCGMALQVRGPRPNIGAPARYNCNPPNVERYGCGFYAISVAELDSQVWARLCAFLTQPEQVATALRRAWGDQDEHDVQTDLDAIDRRAKQIERRRMNLTDALAEAGHPGARVPILDQLSRYAQELDELAATRAEVTTRQAQREAARAKLDQLHLWCQTVAAGLDTMTLDERRIVLRALDITVEVFPASAPERWRMTGSLPIMEAAETKPDIAESGKNPHQFYPPSTLRVLRWSSRDTELAAD